MQSELFLTKRKHTKSETVNNDTYKSSDEVKPFAVQLQNTQGKIITTKILNFHHLENNIYF